MQEYMNVLRKYVDFTGRARRREYWMFTLFSIIIVAVLAILVGLTGGFPTGGDSSPSVLSGIFLGLYSLYALAVFLPSLAVTVRRLHDTGRSGWWYLINFVPLVGWIVLLVFLVSDSEPGTNKWGPNLKGMQAVTGAF